jgi:hypothetical protein
VREYVIHAAGVLETLAKFMVLPTLASLVFGALYWYIGERQLHLVVWQPGGAIRVYPSDKVRDRLPIMACGAEVEQLGVIDVELVNEGTTAIGTPSELWSLSLVVPNALCVHTIRTIEISSRALIVTSHTDSDPRRVSLRLGVFEPRAFVKMRLLVVNDKDALYPDLKMETSLPGLPREVIRSSRVEYRGARLMIPIWGFLSLLGIGQFAVSLYKEIRATAKEVRAQWGWRVWTRFSLKVAGNTIGILILSMFGAYFIAIGLSWALAWLR